MGLDFNHANAHWSYSGFNTFRERLAAELGLNWDLMTGNFLTGTPPDETENQRFLAMKDPIEPLLMHSDCEGELSPDQCAAIAPRLLELIAGWPDGDYDKAHGTWLAEGMLYCAEERVALEFQ